MSVSHHPGVAYRADIDGLRSLAIIPVVLFHANLAFPGGYVGVDVFFVISGFLITRIIYSDMVAGKFTYADFYERRLRRLLPAAFAVFSATTVWAFLKLTWFDLGSYGQSLTAAVAYFSNFNFYWETGYFNDDATTKLLLHTWSLAVEEQFYIVVPLLLALLLRFVPQRFILHVLALATLVSFVLSIVLTQHRPMAAFYLLPARAWELGIGGLLALGGREWARGRIIGEMLSLGGVFAILTACILFTEATPFPGWAASLPVLGCAALLAAGDAPGTFTGRVLRARPLVLVGQVSYSLYLWHWPVMVALSYGTDKLSGGRSVLAIAISLVLAFASLHLIEQPVRRKSVFGTRRQLFVFATVGSVVFIGTGLALVAGDGFPRRFPGSERMVKWTEEVGPGGQPANCYGQSALQIRANDLCVRGRAGVKPHFVLIGDSHAAAVAPALFAAADSLGVSGVQITSSGYMLLPGRRNLGIDYAPQITPDVLAWLEHRHDIRTIVITGYWLYEATSRTYRHQGTIFADDKYDGSGIAYDPIALRNALVRLFEMFPDRHFVILDDVPSGREIYIKHHLRGLVARGQGADHISRANAEEQQRQYMPVIEAAARGRGNVAVHKVLTGAVCDARRCTLFAEDGTLKFSDGDHLSPPFAVRLAPMLVTELRADLTR